MFKTIKVQFALQLIIIENPRKNFQINENKEYKILIILKLVFNLQNLNHR